VVNKNHKSNRFAFTMIELVFAIVIISIAVLSLPMMSQITSKGIENSMVQEAIFAASADLMGASAGYWDGNSMEDNAVSHISRVIDINHSDTVTATNGACENNSSSDRFRLKLGHVAQPFHRRCLDSNTTDPSDGANASFPSLNNAEHNITKIFTDTTTDASGYKTVYYSKIDVNRTGNVKKITVEIYDENSSDALAVRLFMYSANIGETDYYKRRFY